MRCLPLAVALVGCAASAVAQDVIFFDGFESGDTAGWWAPARVGKTGQIVCYDGSGATVDCVGTGQDGELRSGVAWPVPRFEDNLDGTVTDMLTGLVWLKDASCSDLAGTGPSGAGAWTTAVTAAATLSSPTCGLSDGSQAGEWRLPSANEIQSLVHYGYSGPALGNTTGTGQWSDGDPFVGVQADHYWSSTSVTYVPDYGWYLYLYSGALGASTKPDHVYYVWPVRNGR